MYTDVYDTQESLIVEWKLFCHLNNIEPISADEVDHEDLTDEQSEYINDFIERWNIVC